MVTIKDIAAKTGFSPATISLVLNNRKLARSMSASTRKTIREAALEMGYRPNVFAQSLRSKRSLLVGLLVYDVLDPYCAPIVKQIEAGLIPQNYTLLISDLGYDQTRFREALDGLTWRRVDGIVAIANHFPNEIDALRKAAEQTPVVVIGRAGRDPNVPCFVVGDRRGGELSSGHLLDMGHREIGFIWDSVEFEWSGLRWQGVEKAFTDRKCHFDDRRIARVTEKSSDAGYEAARKLLSTHSKLTAICAINDLTAIGAIRAAVDMGRRVPDDISVIGFDDLWLARHYNPPLTTIQQPLERLGQLATAALLTRMSHPRKNVEGQTLKPTLVVRQSTRKLRKL